MMNRWLLALIGLFSLMGMVLAKPDEPKPPLPPPVDRPVDYTKDIQPIVAKHCLACHGPMKQKSGLRLDTGEFIHKGGNSGPALVAGKSADSLLIHLVAGHEPEREMPPSEKKLSADEIGLLRAWIDQGASYPKEPKPEKEAAQPATSTHWAFQPIKRPDVPSVKQPTWLRNPIDAFILAKLERENVAPSLEADRLTLLRRVYLDLIGLPPRPEEIDDFLNDQAVDAYERLVDRLLASPHYGERWGRYWLDLARYADSDGYEKDTGRPWAWRYRQWVIDALNRDLPYDRFVIEQLAGDLLEQPTPDQLAATGFHRNTLTNKEGGVDEEEFRVAAVVDRVNTTSSIFLGLTMSCTQCHDHKYEPFTQREFYQLFAFFNDADEVDVEAPLPGDRAKHAFLTLYHDRMQVWLKASVDGYKAAHQAAQQEKWEANLKVLELRKFPQNIQTILLLEPAKRNAEQAKTLAQFFDGQDKKLAELNKKLREWEQKRPVLTRAQAFKKGPGRKTHVMIRGDFMRPGVEVTAGTPAVLPPLSTTAVVASQAPTSGPAPANRLDLAQWIASPANPLTARVLANWVWMHHFGRGIVETANDFGTRGDPPSHPELLDWLAHELIHQGWSMKQLHRSIVTSATYRQSSHARPELTEKDPRNRWLARQNRLRLEAEIIRDNALAASGLLVRKVGGPSVRPPQPPGISELTYASSARWVESQGPDRYRRGLYTWFQRTSPYPMLMTFDSPDSNVCCMKRDRTNTPLQALTLLNDRVFMEAAQAMGQRLFKTEAQASDDVRMAYLYRWALARLPSERERIVLHGLLKHFRDEYQQQPAMAESLIGAYKPPAAIPLAEAAAWTALARTVLNLDEFITRE